MAIEFRLKTLQQIVSFGNMLGGFLPGLFGFVCGMCIQGWLLVILNILFPIRRGGW